MAAKSENNVMSSSGRNVDKLLLNWNVPKLSKLKWPSSLLHVTRWLNSQAKNTGNGVNWITSVWTMNGKLVEHPIAPWFQGITNVWRTPEGVNAGTVNAISSKNYFLTTLITIRMKVLISILNCGGPDYFENSNLACFASHHIPTSSLTRINAFLGCS